MSPAPECASLEQTRHLLDHRQEKVRFPPTKPCEREIGVTDEWPQDPPHLGSDQSENNDPELENPLDVAAEDAVLQRVQWPGRRCRFRGLILPRHRPKRDGEA